MGCCRTFASNVADFGDALINTGLRAALKVHSDKALPKDNALSR